MIKKIKLKFGSAPGKEALEFEPGHITIFVGPNNSGKSLLLRELQNFCESGPKAGQLILDHIGFILPEDKELDKVLKDLSKSLKQGTNLRPGQILFGKINSTKGLLQSAVSLSDLITFKTNNFPAFASHYLKLFTSRMGGKERFDLTNEQSSGDLQAPPNTNLMALFKDDIKRKEVRDIIYEAFKKYFVIDPTAMGKLRIKMSDSAPATNEMERGWGEQSVNFHSRALDIKTMSDGVQAFTGLILAALIGEEKYLMIDEPEAFLHPSLSNLLGKKMSEILSRRDGNLFVSTHSPNFIMGCIQSGKKVNVVRLTYSEGNIGTARILSSADVSRLFKNPLLRSIGVLQSLFYSFVIVTEADTDRAFYNEINERLLSFEDTRGIKNCLIINAQNKQTVWDIVKPLRNLGIPAAAIVDIDFVKDGGTEFSKALDACKFPDALKESEQTLRATIKGKLEATGKNMKMEGGIELLKGTERETAERFLSDMREYGLFIVPGGEVESWLKHLGVTGHGPKWLIPMFDRVKDDAGDPDYVKPSDKDVWLFMGEINKWFSDDNKKGLR